MLTTDYPPFRPAGFLNGPHRQTLAAFMAPGLMSVYSAAPRVVQLADGDRLVVHDDKPKAWITGDRIVIMLHGLGGCHGSSYMRRTADRLRRAGIRVVRVDLRGCGTSKFISRGHMHAGCSHDLNDVVRFVLDLSPISKITLVGFSLGGNIVLKTVGDWGIDFPRNVDSTIAVGPPIDLAHSSWNLRQWGNRFYDYYYAMRIKNQVTERRYKVANLIDNGAVLPNRLVHLDDQFVAPVSGFRGADQYYERCSSAPLLKNINVPTVILTAQDDPIVPFEMFSNFEKSSYVDLVSPKYGGHLGFVGRHPTDPDRHWMEWRISKWIAALDDV